jgi:hypothetical protein
MDYETMVTQLRLAVHSKRQFKRVLGLINNDRQDEIVDPQVKDLAMNIAVERARICTNFETQIDDLDWINKVLIHFGEEAQHTKTQARKLLKTKVFINIYDLMTGKYDRRTTKELLKKELRTRLDRRFRPSTKILKLFLIKS